MGAGSNQRFPQRQCLIIRIRDECVQKFTAVAKSGGELIERFQICAGRVSHLQLPNFAEFSRENGMLLGFAADDIDVFQPGPAIKPQVREILPEKSEAFAEKEDRDQRENNDRDQRIAAEECFDRCLGRQATTARSIIG